MQVSSSLSINQTKNMQGLYVHWDASNKDSLIFSDGTVGTDTNGVITGSVVQWNNLVDQNQRVKGTKHGIPNIFTHVASEMPTYSASVAQCNNMPALYFDNDGDILLHQQSEMVRGDASNGESPLRYSRWNHRHKNYGETTFFIVAYVISGGDTQARLFEESVDGFYFSPNWGAGTSRTRGPGGEYGDIFSLTQDEFALFDFKATVVDTSVPNADIILRRNDVSVSSETNSSINDWPPTYQSFYPAYFSIGAETNINSTGTGARTNKSFYGFLCEFMMFDRTLSDNEMAAMRNYLNTKWGIY